jgi:Ca2+-transporting ATPase
MGITGTEATKQAADMVITDDDFASIVAAVEEGRGIYDNIAKTLVYLMAGNTGELLLMLAAVLAGFPLPLLPIQLLWINLVTDGLPALALATDPADPEVLRRPPRPAGANLMDRRFFLRLLFIGSLTASCTLAAFLYELQTGDSVESARNAAFTVLVFEELLRSFGARSETRTVAEVGILSNLKLLGIVLASFGLQLAIHHVPALAAIFDAQPASPQQYAAWILLASVPMLTLELAKVRGRRRRSLG